MLTVTIVTPDRRVMGPVSVQSMTLPGADGELTVLPGHARLLSALRTGVMSYIAEDGKANAGAISTGFVEVYNDKVTLLAETLELAHEIDVDRARRAREKAEERLKAQQTFMADEAVKWQRKSDRAAARIQAAHLLPPTGPGPKGRE